MNCGFTQADLTYEVLDVSTSNAITTYPWLTSISTGSLGVDLSAQGAGIAGTYLITVKVSKVVSGVTVFDQTD